jgi:hypothetical protein
MARRGGAYLLVASYQPRDATVGLAYISETLVSLHR